jgi:hypothetical protein
MNKEDEDIQDITEDMQDMSTHRQDTSTDRQDTSKDKQDKHEQHFSLVCSANTRAKDTQLPPSPASQPSLEVVSERPPVSKTIDSGQGISPGHKGILVQLVLGRGIIPDSHIEELATIGKSSTKRDEVESTESEVSSML